MPIMFFVLPCTSLLAMIIPDGVVAMLLLSLTGLLLFQYHQNMRLRERVAVLSQRVRYFEAEISELRLANAELRRGSEVYGRIFQILFSDEVSSSIQSEKARRLAYLSIQEARFGYNTSPEILSEIEDLKKELGYPKL